jgi:hypothetical protein
MQGVVRCGSSRHALATAEHVLALARGAGEEQDGPICMEPLGGGKGGGRGERERVVCVSYVYVCVCMCSASHTSYEVCGGWIYHNGICVYVYVYV